MNRSRSPLGAVYLVGAGPGDPGLLTVRAAELLGRADVVIFDALANPRLLELAPPAAERIDAGKRGGGRRTPQHEIQRLLIDAASRASVVVRLKGGDPFVFGRGGEEALALAAAGVPFEVVPGVTAGVGAAAYAGIPLTHRDHASAVTFVTGHEEAARSEGRVDWEALGRGGGTLVIYMGMSRLRQTAQRLIRAGRAPDTPAAAVEWGTYPFQRTVSAPLAEIATAVERGGVGSPAIIVVGAVAALRERLAWFERRQPDPDGRRDWPERPEPAGSELGTARSQPSPPGTLPPAFRGPFHAMRSKPPREAQGAGTAARRARVTPER